MSLIISNNLKSKVYARTFGFFGGILYNIFYIALKDKSDDLTLGNNKIKLVDFVHTYKGVAP